MKKLCILFLFVFVLVGCDSKVSPTKPEELNEKPTIDYKSTFSITNIYDEPIEIFQSIYVESLNSINEFSVKHSVFDQKAIETFQIKSISTGSSESSRNTHYKNTYTLLEDSTLITNKSFDYFENCRTNNYQNYLSKVFIEDLTKLEQNSITVETLVNTYGTHIICSYSTGYLFGYQLTVSNTNINHSMFSKVKDTILSAFPMVIPYQDVTYLDIASKSEINLTIRTNSTKTALEDLLNEYNGDLNEPNYKMLEYKNLMPLHELVVMNLETFSNAYERLKTWHKENYPN